MIKGQNKEMTWGYYSIHRQNLDNNSLVST